MKNVCLILLLITTGCSVIAVNPFEDKAVKKIVIYDSLDFRDYTKKGFFFITEKYEGAYEPVGMVEVLILPEIVKNPEAKDKFSVWKEIPVSYSEVIDSLYQLSTRMGADAVMNLRLSVGDSYNWNEKYYGPKASGFAIKRITTKQKD